VGVGRCEGPALSSTLRVMQNHCATFACRYVPIYYVTLAALTYMGDSRARHDQHTALGNMWAWTQFNKIDLSAQLHDTVLNSSKAYVGMDIV
jgi:hypothetical protein